MTKFKKFLGKRVYDEFSSKKVDIPHKLLGPCSHKVEKH